MALFVGTIFLHAYFVSAEFFECKIEIFIFDLVIVGLVIVGFLTDALSRMGMIKKKVDFPRDNVEKMNRYADLIASFFAITVIAVLAFYIPKMRLPFPLVSFDSAVGFEAIRPVTRLLDDGVLDLFKARGLPVILQAIVCSLSNVPILNLSWAAPLSTSLIFSFSMFSLTYSITKKKIVALASVLLAAFINSSGLFFDVTYFVFRYSTIITAVFPLVIQEVYLHFVKVKDGKEKTRPLIVLLIVTVFLISVFYVFELLQPSFLTTFFMINEFFRPFLSIIFLSFVFYYVATLKSDQQIKKFVILLSLFTVFVLSLDIFRPVTNVVFIYFFLLLLTQTSLENAKKRSLLSETNTKKHITPNIRWSNKINILRILAFLMMLWTILLLGGYINFADYSFVSGWTISSSTKSQSLIISNSSGVLVLFFVTCTFLLLSTNMRELALSFSSVAALFIFFLPIAETNYVAHNILNIFMGFVIAAGLFKVKSRLSKREKIRKLGSKISMKYLSNGLYLLMILIIFIPIFGSSITRFTWVPEGANRCSILTDYESKSLAEYISKLPDDTRIISDLFTMIYISSLTNRIGLVDVGMAPFTEQYKSRDSVIAIWSNIFHGNSSLEIYSSVVKFKDTVPHDEKRFIQRIQRPLDLSKFVIIISGRTQWWIDHNDPFGWFPLFSHTYDVTPSSIEHFFDPTYFTLTYKIDGKIYIFSVE